MERLEVHASGRSPFGPKSDLLRALDLTSRMHEVPSHDVASARWFPSR
ncbi:MAG: hypothetical protein GXP55_23175 [Deltaproteobacteria bacterium]|nr:hypothetical protein [Deltaproteobacteria bacterium]